MYEDFRLSRSSRFTMIDKYIYMSISGISVGAFWSSSGLGYDGRLIDPKHLSYLCRCDAPDPLDGTTDVRKATRFSEDRRPPSSLKQKERSKSSSRNHTLDTDAVVEIHTGRTSVRSGGNPNRRP